MDVPCGIKYCLNERWRDYSISGACIRCLLELRTACVVVTKLVLFDLAKNLCAVC